MVMMMRNSSEHIELVATAASDDGEAARSRTQGPSNVAGDSVEFVVVLQRETNTQELGFDVLGGINTYLRGVVVECVHEDGPAAEDGRLRRGDVLLQVNDVLLTSATHAEAIAALRTPTNPVRLRVRRENPEALFTSLQEPSTFITVELRKSVATEALGLSLMERSDGQGIFVTWVEPGSLAARFSEILQGDKLLEVNGVPVTHQPLRLVCLNLKKAEGEVFLLMGRIPSLLSSIQRWAASATSSSSTTSSSVDPTPTPESSRRSRTVTWSSQPLQHRHSTGASSSRSSSLDLSFNELDSSSSPVRTAGYRGSIQYHRPRSKARREPSLLKVLRNSLRVQAHANGDTTDNEESADSSCASDKPML